VLYHKRAQLTLYFFELRYLALLFFKLLLEFFILLDYALNVPHVWPLIIGAHYVFGAYILEHQLHVLCRRLVTVMAGTHLRVDFRSGLLQLG
jgi:hypothetical protein